VVEYSTLEELPRLLAGRSKRDLITGMLVRSPHPAATEKLMLALEPYPLLYLLLAEQHPTQIWILDRDEKVSSAGVLTPEMRTRRWHSWGLTVDDCDGITDAAPGYVAMVCSWKSLLVMRHEFAHVVTTFFTPAQRAILSGLYARALATNHFMEPLARESQGEYVACALTYSFFPDLAEELARFDASLFRFVVRLRQRADDCESSFLGSPPDGEPRIRRSDSCRPAAEDALPARWLPAWGS
jgi:hypothetical protein